MVDFGFRQGPSEFSTAGIAVISRIENQRERRRGPKDAVYGWTLTNLTSQNFYKLLKISVRLPQI